MLNALLDAELTKVLGVDGQWMKVIEKAVGERVQGATQDDFVATVSGNIVLLLRAKEENGLTKALAKARESAATEDELRKSFAKILRRATKFRVTEKGAVTNSKVIYFSHMADEGATLPGRLQHSDENLHDRLLDELEKMKEESDSVWHRHRLSEAKKFVEGRLAGEKSGDLRERLKIKKGAKTQAINEMIAEAVERLG
jgi:hypothetical protein